MYTMLNSYCSHHPSVVVDKQMIEISRKSKPTSSPQVFGPPTWAYLHISTAYLPEHLNETIATQVRNTLIAVPAMVPCESCALHSGNFMIENKARLESLKSGSDFFKFTVDLHNFVNERLGKQIISYAKAKEIWKQ